MVDREPIRVLFICSMNQWRSPTAERIYADNPLVIARSRGTARNARTTVSAGDLKWADIVFVMEEKHRQRLRSQFPGEMQFKDLYVLDIPDNYRYMDQALIDEIRSSVDPILSKAAN